MMIVSVVLLLGGVFLFLREQGTREELRRAQTQSITTSNQLFEARVKVTEQVVNSVKLETNLARRVDELVRTTSRLAAANEKLGRIEALFQASQNQAQDLQKQLALSQARAGDLERGLSFRQLTLERQSEELKRVTSELGRVEKQLVAVELKLQYFETKLSAARDEFNDPLALRRQIDHLKRVSRPLSPATDSLSHGAHQLATREAYPKGRLALQPDGSVRVNP